MSTVDTTQFISMRGGGTLVTAFARARDERTFRIDF
jgi:hypothetical protein